MWPLFLNDSQTPNIIYFLTQRVYKGAYFFNVGFFFLPSTSIVLCHLK